MTYQGLIEEVSRQTGMSPRTTRRFVDTVIATVVTAVQEEGFVKLLRLGKFWRDEKVISGQYRARLRFSTTRALRKRMSDKTEAKAMEKYGVEIDDNDKSKKARITGKCPDCGNPLSSDTGTLLCGKCGTKPFEDQK
jgi:nucleoid DNA-binding protein/ribosomal protein S27AE